MLLPKKCRSKCIFYNNYNGVIYFVVNYCLCKQEKYGQMIACDNNKCKNQWFHFDCVGLTDAPKGQWFCENCKI